MTPIEKLIDVAASGIGAIAGPLLLPYKAKMQAKADIIEAKGKADSTKLIAQAQAEAKDILIQKQKTTYIEKNQTNIEMNAADLVQTKIQFQEEKRLNNIQNIVSQAKDKLPDQVNNKPVDPDWTARFFQNAQDISTEEMQQIWSSILAGEVETPGRTSLRTLDILKNMTKKEAELFSAVMRYKIGSNIFHNIKNIDNYTNVKHNDILLLGEWGLIQSGLGLSIQINGEKYTNLGSHGDHLIRLYTESKQKISISVHLLTQPAIELSLFLNCSTDFKYLRLLSQFFRQKNYQLQIAKIIRKEGGNIIYDNNSFKPIES